MTQSELESKKSLRRLLLPQAKTMIRMIMRLLPLLVRLQIASRLQELPLKDQKSLD